MKTLRSIYYCNECKKITGNIEEVIFVEQMKYRCFCSEKCIINFYTPLIKHFEDEEKVFRDQNKIVEPLTVALPEREKMLELTLKGPDELWHSQVDLSEEVYFFIKNLDAPYKCSVLAATLMFDGNPSFILMETITNSSALLDFYRRGRKIDVAKPSLLSSANNGNNKEEDDAGLELLHLDPEAEQNQRANTKSNLPSHRENFAQPLDLDPELVRFVESKKSHFLARLLKDRTEDDIPFEDYPLYDSFLQETLENPDEIYQQNFENEESDLPYFVYIKSFQRDERNFFYVVISLHYQTDHDNLEETLIPIISFPSKNAELYKKYKRGKRMDGHSVS